MIFFDLSFLSSDSMTIPLTPTDIDNITSIEIKNAWFDDLHVTNDVEGDYIETNTVPEDWDFDTILHAKFDGNLIAGNVDFTLQSVSGFLIKHRKHGDFDWMPLFYYPVDSIEDFNVKFMDRTCAFNYDYEHAFVPVLNGIEGIYATTDVEVKSNRLVVIDDEELWSTAVTDGYCDTTRIAPSGVVETLYNKYPTIIRNTMANYDTVTVSGTFIPSNSEDGCNYVNMNDGKSIGMLSSMSKDVMDFLTNSKTKLLKNIDGRMWLCYVTTPPSDVAKDIYNNRKISFGVTETGDYNIAEDLFEAGLITATEEWW